MEYKNKKINHNMVIMPKDNKNEGQEDFHDRKLATKSGSGGVVRAEKGSL